jgi:hypothetical protein
MTGYFLEVGHQAFRVTEDEVVYTLEDRLFPNPVVVRSNQIGVIDMPNLEELRSGEIAPYGELGKNRLQIMFSQDDFPFALILSG